MNEEPAMNLPSRRSPAGAGQRGPAAIPAEVRTMMPYDAYRLYQAERAKSPRETQRAGEQATRLASAVSCLVRAITGPVRAARSPHPAAGHVGASRLAEPATCRGAMAGAMEGS